MDHCKLQCGDVIGGYSVDKQLGQGRFSTVYKITLGDSVYALKVYRCGNSNARYYYNEAKILGVISGNASGNASGNDSGNTNLIEYNGTFAHVSVVDFVPRIYPCMLFEICGDNIGRLIRSQWQNHKQGLPIHIVKNVMRQLLTALDYIHVRSIVHTDVKPGNIFMKIDVDDFDSDVDCLEIRLGDLGSATFCDDIFSHHVGTTPYMAPELILELNYDTSIDIWATLTTCYEMLTGELLFDVYGECNVNYGSDLSKISTATSCSDSNGSSSSSPEQNYRNNYRHLSIIEKILGAPDTDFTENGRYYYNNRGRLKNNPSIEHTSISMLLCSQYEFDDEIALEIQEFLICGLTFNPEERASAHDLFLHRWLQNI